MNLLIDTHVLLWLASNPEKLSSSSLALCANPTTRLTVSIVSFWELSIKISLQKIDMPKDAIRQLRVWCMENQIDILPIRLDDCEVVQSLPFHHRDPFDRMIIAQAMTRELSVMSADQYFSAYACKLIVA